MNNSKQTPKIKTDTFTITYATPCTDAALSPLTVVTQTATVSNSYTGAASWTYTPYKVKGNLCPLTLTCESVSGPTGVTGFACPCGSNGCTQATHTAAGVKSTGSFTISKTYDSAAYKAAGTPPGTYTYNFKVSTGGVGTSLNKSFSVVQTVVDPCKKASGITINDVTMNT